jgi:hypothetical protein
MFLSYFLLSEEPLHQPIFLLPEERLHVKPCEVIDDYHCNNYVDRPSNKSGKRRGKENAENGTDVNIDKHD